MKTLTPLCSAIAVVSLVESHPAAKATRPALDSKFAPVPEAAIGAPLVHSPRTEADHTELRRFVLTTNDRRAVAVRVEAAGGKVLRVGRHQLVVLMSSGAFDALERQGMASGYEDRPASMSAGENRNGNGSSEAKNQAA